MMALIVEIFGTSFGTQIVISFSGVFELFFCSILFNLKTRKRDNYFLWLFFCFCLCIASGFILAFLRYLTGDNFIAKTIVHSLITILVMTLQVFILYDKTTYQKLLTLCASYATYMLTGRLISLLLNAFGVDDKLSISFFSDYNEVRDWAIYIILHLVLYFILGFIFYHRDDIIETPRSKRNTLLLTIPSVLLSSFLFSLSDPYQSESWMLTILLKFFSCIICILILVLRSGILRESKGEEEKVVLAELFKQEKAQFDNLRLSTEAINAKFHDIRHQLNSMSSKLTEEEKIAFRQATDMYDSTINTGNDVLNAVLYEKQLIAKKENIRLSALCDGKLLSFMEETEIYSLIANALNNAFEAVRSLPKDKRIVDITLRNDKGLTILNVTNYYQGNVTLSDEGLPISSKKDGANHGYGSKSIRLIAQRYKGTLSYSIDEEIFSLSVSFSLDAKGLDFQSSSQTEESHRR